MTAAEHFTTDPTEARHMFLAACLDTRLPVASFESPRGAKTSAPVHLDIAQAGRAGAPLAIVISPGNRLAEGLCASGIQTTLLRTGLQIEVPQSTSLLLIHTTTPGAFKSADWDWLGTENTAEPVWDDTLLAAAEVRYTEETQPDAEGDAPDSTHQQWCTDVISIAAERFLSAAKRVVFLDIHTGSGPYGEAELVSCHMPGTAAERRATDLFGARTSADGIAASNIEGPITRGLSAALGDRELTSLVLEFGGYSLTTVLDSLLTRHKSTAEGGDRFDGLFYPDAADWREIVWGNAADILRHAFASLDRTELRLDPDV